MGINNIFKLVAAIAVSLSAGAVGSLFTAPSIQSGWYAELVKPALNPPSWIFGPVWTALYILMGIAAFLIWSFQGAQDEKKKALAIFGLQLLLNASWSIVFFGFQNPGLALVNIVLLWLAIVWTMFAFYRISKPASYLLAPYLVWVSFASYLNYSIWMLN